MDGREIKRGLGRKPPLRDCAVEGEQADYHPCAFHHGKAYLQWTQRDIGKNGASGSVQEIVGYTQGIHRLPFHLMADVRDEDERCANRRQDLGEH